MCHLLFSAGELDDDPVDEEGQLLDIYPVDEGDRLFEAETCIA